MLATQAGPVIQETNLAIPVLLVSNYKSLLLHPNL